MNVEQDKTNKKTEEKESKKKFKKHTQTYRHTFVQTEIPQNPQTIDYNIYVKDLQH